MSFICPSYKGELEKEIPVQIHQRQNLIVDEYDGEILEKNRSMWWVLQGQVLNESKAFQDKFTDEETLMRRGIDNMKTKELQKKRNR